MADQVDMQHWRDWATSDARGRVLEIGAGSGSNFTHYGRGARVVAIDPNIESLLESDTGHRSIVLACASAEALPFPPGCFDTGVATLVFCSIPNPPLALSELRRVLKPGASLRLVEHVRSMNSLLGGFMDAVTPLWKRVARGCHLNRDTLSAVQVAGIEVLGTGYRYGSLLVGIRARNPS